MVAVFIFFVAIEPLRDLEGEPSLLEGYDVTEFIGKLHTYGGHL
jgi:hypothetical protein